MTIILIIWSLFGLFALAMAPDCDTKNWTNKQAIFMVFVAGPIVWVLTIIAAIWYYLGDRK